MAIDEIITRTSGQISTECVVRCARCLKSQALATDDEVTAATNAHYLCWWYDNDAGVWRCPECNG